MIVLGLIAIVIAGGFWNGWKIMWYLGFIFSAISIIFSIYTIVTTGTFAAEIIPIIINLIIIFYLTRQGVKEFFGVA